MRKEDKEGKEGKESMERGKKSNYIKLFCVVAVCALTVALLCSVGITYGRYMTTLPLDVPFQVKANQSFYLFTSGSTEGVWQEMTQGTNLPWVQADKVQNLSFLLSNGDLDEKNIGAEDMTLRIRVFVPDTEVAEENGAGSGLGNLTMELVTEADGKSYSAKGEYLSAQTPMYQDTDYGPGWVYSFYTGDGEEFYTTLTGGSLQKTEMTILLEGETVDTSIFQLSIDKIQKM